MKYAPNLLRRQWQVTFLTTEVNRIKTSATHQLYEWRNDQRSNALDALDPENE
jgi:hypothetical protein